MATAATVKLAKRVSHSLLSYMAVVVLHLEFTINTGYSTEGDNQSADSLNNIGWNTLLLQMMPKEKKNSQIKYPPATSMISSRTEEALLHNVIWSLLQFSDKNKVLKTEQISPLITNVIGTYTKYPPKEV